MTGEGGRRCICGRARTYPLCDGTHGDGAEAGWACHPARLGAVPFCFLASAANRNLAERLAHTLGGITAEAAAEVGVVDRLVVLLEGPDLAELAPLAARVPARAREAWALTPAATAACALLDGYTRVPLVDTGRGLWEELLGAARHERAPVRGRPLVRAFLSHAVADEGALSEPLDQLRRWHGADLFLCADSIPPGAAWEATILTELRARPLFVVALSAAQRASTSCAFEAGMARALGKRITLVSLDGTAPPPFLAHLQAIDVPRRHAARPWMRPRAVLAEALLEAMLEME